MQSLQRQADQIGRANVGDNVENLVKQLREGNDGLNREFLNIIASIRGLSVDQVMKEFRKNIVGAQNAAVAERQNLAGRKAEEQNINSFNRLLLAVQSASDSLLGLRQKAQALSEVFDGTVSASHVSSRSANLEQLGRNDRGALIPLGTVATVGGDIGQRLRQAGGQVDDLARVLPGILSTSVAQAKSNATGSDLVSTIEEQLKSQLGAGSGGVISSVVRQLNELTKQGPSRLFDEVSIDTTKLTQQLIQPLAAPIKDIGGKFAKEVEDNANRLVDGLSQVANRIRQIGETYDQLAKLQVASFRQQLTFASERAGQNNSNLIFRAPLTQLEHGFNAQQERLAGVQGAAAFDPAFLGRRLVQVRGALPGAIARQQEAFQATGGRGQAFQQAAQEVLRLKTASANYIQALKNLTETTNRNAVAQERLNRLQEERNSRRSFVRQYATASNEEKVQINRGILLANQAHNQGDKLDNFTPEQIREVFNTLERFGNATLTGFKGGPRADDLIKNLEDNLFGGVGRLNQGQQQEQKQLQETVSGRLDTAAKAMEELAKHQKDANDDFFTTLKDTQNQFFTRLEAQLARENINEVQNKQGSAARRFQQLNSQSEQANLLGSVGIKTNAQLEAARRNRADVEGYVGSYATIAQESAKAQQLFGSGQLRKLLNDNQNLKVDKQGNGVPIVHRFTEEMGRLLENNFGSVNEAQRGSILARFQNGLAQDQTIKIGNATNVNGNQRQLLFKRFEKAVYEELAGGGADTVLGKAVAGAQGHGEKLLGQGIDLGALADLAKAGGGEKIKAALDAFKDSKLEDFPKDLKDADQALKNLTAELENLQEAIKRGEAAGGKHLASGGNVASHPGGPRGSDTVPAWLTPGEFVVRRDSAQANMGLLNKLNRAGGPLRLADGGPVHLTDIANRKYTPEQEEEIRENHRKAREAANAAFARAAGRRRTTGVPVGDATPLAKIRERELAQAKAPAAAPGPNFIIDENGRVVPQEAQAKAAPRPNFVLDENGRVVPQEVQAAAANGPDDKLKRALDFGRRRAAAPAAAPRQQAQAKGNDADAELRFQAATNPFGASALTLQRRAVFDLAQRQQQALRRRRGGRRNAGLELAQRNALVGQALAAQHFAGQAHFFNQRVGLGQVIDRPGSEAQRNVAGQGFQLQQQGADQAARRDFDFQKFLRQHNQAQGFAQGGSVPGAGTHDSVPALLTPGEFVLNQGAVARAGAHNLQRFNKGGMVGAVQYHATGGQVGGDAGGVSEGAISALNQLSATLNKFVQQSGGFAQVAQQLTQTFTAFGGHAQALTEAINNMPKSLTLQGTHTVNVTINGAEVLSKLTPEIQGIVVSQVRSSLSRIFKEHMPDANVQVE
jgi:hypothetical protein